MRINKKMLPDIEDRFEAALDAIPGLDKVPFYIKREAAVEAAYIAFQMLLAAKETAR
jgi:hypothetical protein